MTTNDTDIENKRAALKPRLEGSNVSPVSFLATDYLNHFNEVLMLFEMGADMPDMLDELLEWEPKSYVDHFKESSIADKDLAVEAYEICPSEFKTPFDRITQRMDDIITISLASAIDLRDQGKTDELGEFISTAMQRMHRTQDVMSAIIHGDRGHLNQENIDSLINE